MLVTTNLRPSDLLIEDNYRSWEIPVDNVYLDGSVLPQSTLSTGVSLSALLDTACILYFHVQ